MALVYPWMTFHTSTGLQVIKGMAQEIVDHLVARKASPGHMRDTVGFVYSVTPYHPEEYKILILDLLKEAGVDLLLHSTVTDVDVNNGVIEKVFIHNKNGVSEVVAKTYVDSTGDADVSYFAGALGSKGIMISILSH